jgi:hypothetical protein
MPPWLPEPGFGEFANARKLSVDQIGTIRQWIAEGTLEGSPSDRPAPPHWSEGWRLGEPDLVLRMPEPYTLASSGKDIYRNFVIPIPTSGARYVEAVEFLPDNPKIVHHAFMKIDPTRESRRLDEKDPEPGFSFMITPDSAQMPDGHFLNWTPGSRPSREAKGLAWTLREGSDLVLQAHLNSSGKPETIQSSVGLYFTDTPPTNAPFKILLTSRAIDIPAAMKSYVVRDAFVLPVDIEVLAVLPHAHYLGHELQAYATLPDGKKKWLLRIRDWNFDWQEAYRYTAPFFLPKGTTLSMHFTYDNSTGNVRNPNHPPRRVMYGPQTTDEMAELWVQVLARSRDDREILAKQFQSKMQNVFFEQYQLLTRNKPDDAEAHNGLAKALLGLGQEKEAIKHFRAALEIRPDYEEPHFILGYIFRLEKKLNAAEAEYQRVIRINPDNYEAHGNLGLVLLQLGNLDQAEAEFESALRINPADPIARQNLNVVLRAKVARRKKN